MQPPGFGDEQRALARLRRLLERFHLVPLVPCDDEDAGTLREGRHDFACEPQDYSLVRRAVADDEGVSAVRQGVEDTAERVAEPFRVRRYKPGIGVA